MKCLANTTQFLVMTSILVIVGACDIYYFLNKKWLLFTIFVVFFGIYLISIVTNSGTLIEINRRNVKRHFIWRKALEMNWDEVDEWGIVGTRLFTKIGEYTGTKYLYFSREEMSEDERFLMCLNWPPKDKIYIVYTPKRLEYVMQNIEKQPVYYNVKDKG